MVPFFPAAAPPSSLPGLFCRGRSLQPGKGCSSCILSFPGRAGCGLPRITCVPSSAHIWFVFLARGFSRNTRPQHGHWVLGPFPGRRVPPAPSPWPPAGSCLAEANPGAARGLFPALPSSSDFCLSACERSFIGLFDVVETRTVQTFIKTLPCGPWDYEY